MLKTKRGREWSPRMATAGYIERQDLAKNAPKEGLEALIPRKTLPNDATNCPPTRARFGLGADENHSILTVGPRMLISRTLAGHFRIMKW